MAGTILLIPRKKEDDVKFSSKIDQLKAGILNELKPYYSEITFRDKASNSFLAEFRFDKRNKYYEDENRSWLTFEGIVFDLNNTITYAAKDLFELYKIRGEKVFEELDGHYVIKLYDANTDCYYVVSDYAKSKTNFYTQSDDYIIFTPSLLATAIVTPPRLDHYAFNEFMWRYYILSERSLLKDVKRLSPATIYKVKNGEIEKRTYWKWPKEYTKLDFNSCVKKTRESMMESARLIANEFPKISIDLTQGQDSRQVVAAFKNQNIPFEAFIFGKDDFYEVSNVKDICSRNNIPLMNAKIENDFSDNLWDYFKKAVIVGNGELPGFALSRILYMRGKIAEQNDVSLDGNVGYFYKNGLWDELYTLNLYREPKRFNTELFLKLRMLSKDYKTEIFTDDYLKIKSETKQYISGLVDNVLKDHEKSPVAIQADLFGLYNWLNWGTANSTAIRNFMPNISVLLLRRNLEFATTVPVKWKINLSKYQRALVYQLDPELANEKTDFGGVNMVPKNFFTIVPFYFKYYGFQAHRILNKVKSKLGFKVVTHLQEAWDYLPLYKKLYNSSDFKKNLHYDTLHLKSIIKEKEWEELLASFENEEKSMNDFEYLFKLVSVEYFLREAKKWNTDSNIF
ncbi:hypothetical protein [Maribellus sediminis]|uniref:hypothetical protein n=1 Tax=Maribellus sediminis TaxID=2696285 RepID=UPI001430DE89|nr:hypothetical protein [Maribellus sediminis]